MPDQGSNKDSAKAGLPCHDCVGSYGGFREKSGDSALSRLLRAGIFCPRENGWIGAPEALSCTDPVTQDSNFEAACLTPMPPYLNTC